MKKEQGERSDAWAWGCLVFMALPLVVPIVALLGVPLMLVVALVVVVWLVWRGLECLRGDRKGKGNE